MPNNLALSVTADVVDLQAKRAVMSAELKAATKDLNAFAKEAAATGATEELRAGMLASAEAAEKARAKFALATQELKELNKVPAPSPHGFEGITASISETGIHLRESIGMFTEFRAALMEVAEVIMVAFAVERIAEWADQMGEAAEKTKHLAETFGMTVPEVQGLDAIAKETGLDFEALAKGMGILDKNTYAAAEGNKKAAASLEAVGVAADDGKTQMERMLVIADKFAAMEDGPKKIALSMQLFGKSGKDLIPILNMGSEGLQDMDRVTQEYAAGAMFATAANKELRDWLDQVNARGMALADATDTTKVAMQGLGNVMTDAFSPILAEVTESLNLMVKGFIESYREGGTVKQVMDGLIVVFEAVWEVTKALGEICAEVFGAIIDLVVDVAADIFDAFGVKTPQAMHVAAAAWNVFKDVVVIAKDLILICVESLIAMIQELIGDLLVLGRVAYDALSLNWGSIEGDWANGMARVGKQVEETTNKIKAHAAEMNQAIGAAAHGAAMPGATTEAHAMRATRDFDPAMDGAGKGKKGPSIAQQLEEELEAKKTAWAMEQDAQGTYQQFSLQSEADFWAQALKRADLTAKDRLDVERKYLAARQGLLKQKQAMEAADAKQSEAMASESVKIDYDMARLGIQSRIAALEEQRQLGQITATQELQQKAALNAQLYQLDVDLENKQYAVRLKAMQAERSIRGQDPQYYRNIDNQIELLERQHQDALTRLNAAGEQKRLQDSMKTWEAQHKQQLSAIKGLSNAWSSTLGQMMTGQMAFTQGIKSIWQGLASTIGNVLSGIIQQWLERQLTALILGKVQQGITGVAMVTSNAAVAGSAAFASTAAIPIIGPALAPAAAAAAFAGAMAFAPLASAEGGDWQVREGLYQLHKDEMVLPAWAASPLRNMVSASARGTPANDFGGSAGSGGGDTHIHIHAMDSRDVARFMRDNGRHLAAGVKSAVRNGYRG